MRVGCKGWLHALGSLAKADHLTGAHGHSADARLDRSAYGALASALRAGIFSLGKRAAGGNATPLTKLQQDGAVIRANSQSSVWDLTCVDEGAESHFMLAAGPAAMHVSLTKLL